MRHEHISSCPKHPCYKGSFHPKVACIYCSAVFRNFHLNRAKAAFTKIVESNFVFDEESDPKRAVDELVAFVREHYLKSPSRLNSAHPRFSKKHNGGKGVQKGRAAEVDWSSRYGRI